MINNAITTDTGAGKTTVAAVILAAGSSRRMGQRNKLFECVNGQIMLHAAVSAALHSKATATIVVTGFESDRVESALSDFDVITAHNADYADGMSASLLTGIRAASRYDGALIMLADMPFIDAAVVDHLLQAFWRAGSDTIVAPTRRGRRGNPVLWPKCYFPQLLQIKGDSGARALLQQYITQVQYVDVNSDAVFVDVDTPAMLADIQKER